MYFCAHSVSVVKNLRRESRGGASTLVPELACSAEGESKGAQPPVEKGSPVYLCVLNVSVVKNRVLLEQRLFAPSVAKDLG